MIQFWVIVQNVELAVLWQFNSFRNENFRSATEISIDNAVATNRLKKQRKRALWQEMKHCLPKEKSEKKRRKLPPYLQQSYQHPGTIKNDLFQHDSIRFPTNTLHTWLIEMPSQSATPNNCQHNWNCVLEKTGSPLISGNKPQLWEKVQMNGTRLRGGRVVFPSFDWHRNPTAISTPH